MVSLKDLENRVKKIEARNKRVEKDKAWETSWTRKIFIAVCTYLIVAAYMKFVLKTDPWLNAIVPTGGFLLSTLAMTVVRKIWERD
jgi:hypothetical protein